MGTPSISAPMDAPQGTNKARSLLRGARLLLVLVALALLLDAAVLLFLQSRRPAKPPLSVVFPSPAVVRELQMMAAERPNDPEWRVRLGLAYLAQGHYLSAAASLEEGLRLKGPELTIRSGLSVAYGNLDRFGEALEELQRLVKLEPEKLELQLRVAEMHANLEDEAQALRTLDAIPLDASGYVHLDYGGGRLAALETLATAYAQLGKSSRSLDLARRVLRDDPERYVAHKLAGRALAHLGRETEAAEHFGRALQARPDDPELQLLRVRSLLSSRAAKKSSLAPGQSAELTRLVEALGATASAPGDVCYELGMLYESRREWRRAADAFRRAHDLGVQPLRSVEHAASNYQRAGMPEEGIYLRGKHQEALGRYAEAAEEYRRLTGIHSCCQSGYLHVARAQAKQRQFKAALVTLAKAEALPNPPAKLYAEKASLYASLGDPHKQRNMWREFIRRDPENADVGYQNLGAMADSAGKLDETEELYRKCVELQPDADLYRIRLARHLLQRRTDPARVQEAISHLQRAVELERENSEVYFQLGMAYRYAGRKQEAVWALGHAIDLDPGDGKHYQPLGEALISTGRRAEGQRMLALFKQYRQFHQAWETLRARSHRNPRDLASRWRLAAFYERAGALINAARVYSEVLAISPNDERARRKLAALHRRLASDGGSATSPPAAAAPATSHKEDQG